VAVITLGEGVAAMGLHMSLNALHRAQHEAATEAAELAAIGNKQ
jgi:hypothetical protein